MNFPNIRFDPKLKKTHYNSLANNDKGARKTSNNLQLLKMVSILVPDTSETSDIESCFNYTYYSIENLKIVDMLSKSLIDGYISNGDFFATTMDERCEKNFQFLIANKRLVLKVEKDLFYSLNALQLCRYQTRSESDWIIFELDLLACDLDSIKRELQSEVLDRLDVNFVWNPLSPDICSSSIAKFFADIGYSVSAVDNKSTDSYLFGPKFPKIPSVEDDYEWNSFTECIGMMMLGCDFEENICSSYRLPEETVNVVRAQVLHFSGFIPSFILESALKAMSKILKENSQLPYIALSTIHKSALQRNCRTTSICVSKEKIYLAE